MRIFKWLLGIVLALVVVFVAGAFLLPKEVAVARSIEIEAAPDKIFPYVNSLKAGADWSPWLGRDPEVQLVYSGPDAGVGAKLDWTSEHPQVGNGSQMISLSEPNSKVMTELDFGDMGTAVAVFDLVENNGKTEVTWGFSTDTGNNPVARWMGLMMDRWVGGDYETGLANLKALVEG